MYFAKPASKEQKKKIHPLCSRKRSLAKIVSSPSYNVPQKKPEALARRSLNTSLPKFDYLRRKTYNGFHSGTISTSGQNKPSLDAKKTVVALKGTDTDEKFKRKEKENSIPQHNGDAFSKSITDVAPVTPDVMNTLNESKSIQKTRRVTMNPTWKPAGNISHLNENSQNDINKEECAMTPWKDKQLCMRERLNLWLEANGKTPVAASHSKKMYSKSPHPHKKSLSLMSQNSVSTACKGEDGTHMLKSFSVDNEDSKEMKEELEIIIESLKNNVDEEEIGRHLATICDRYPAVKKCADFWICKARLARREYDVEKVVHILEEAYLHQAEPKDKIKEEICKFLEDLEQNDNKGDLNFGNGFENESRIRYAITPARRVHFATSDDSPIEAKSSVIRFCLLESKAFKRRLNLKAGAKVMTPVRRSIRIQRSCLPNYLQADSRVIRSPGEFENEIVDGDISFIPNTRINTPLNKGWLLQDEINPSELENELELSYM